MFKLTENNQSPTIMPAHKARNVAYENNVAEGWAHNAWEYVAETLPNGKARVAVYDAPLNLIRYIHGNTQERRIIGYL